MQAPQSGRSEVRFEDYCLDLRSGELRHENGKIIRLSEQPFQILTVLLEHPGEVVSREELRQRLWPDDTFVEFEHSISAAMNRLRQVLGDSADAPRFIETLARRGYRFKVPIQTGLDSQNLPLPPLSESSSRTLPARTHLIVLTAAVCVLLLLGSLYFWRTKRSAYSFPNLKQRQITVNSTADPVDAGAISPDGKYLAYSDLNGLHVKLLDTGEVRNFAQPRILEGREVDWVPVWFPDSTTLLANARVRGQRSSIWKASVLGGAFREIRDSGTAWSVSPDGKSVAFTTNPGPFGDREVWLMGPLGEDARKLYDVPQDSGFERLQWSPDGHRLAYLVSRREPGQKARESIETRDLIGGAPVTALSDIGQGHLLDFVWEADGRIIFAAEADSTNVISCNLSEIQIDAGNGKPTAIPKRLTNWAGFCVSEISATSDARHLVIMKWSSHHAVYVADYQIGGTQISALRPLTLSEANENPYAWTPDSKSVIFLTNRTGRAAIFKQALDADEPDLIVMRPKDASMSAPAISPDGSWVLYKSDVLDAPDPSVSAPALSQDGSLVLYKSAPPSLPDRLMRVPIYGGGPQLVLTADLYENGIPRCAIRPATLCVFAEKGTDRHQLIFTAFDPLKGRGRELCRMSIDPASHYEWALSPDGTRVALLKGRNSDGRIQIYSLNGQLLQTIYVPSLDGLDGWLGMDWTADGNGLYVGTKIAGSTILQRINLNGGIEVIIKERALEIPIWAIESPDRRHLAIMECTKSSNLWMIENF